MFKEAITRYQLKLDSIGNIITFAKDVILHGKENATDIIRKKRSLQLKKKYFKNGIWNFNGIKFPDYKEDPEFALMHYVYMDSLFIYCEQNDNYDSSLVDKLDEHLPEGPYGYKNDFIDVTIKKDDVVIDAGAWIGDFSAYASMKGAEVFAFEPSAANISYLKETQKLNGGNIHIVEKGLGDSAGTFFMTNSVLNSGGNQITSEEAGAEKVELTTVDEFVEANQLKKVDFIKSDIEGFERNMLRGAKRTLEKYRPKLAICTYHFPDDPEVLAKIILDANPNYVIVQKRHKLYAMVKK